MATLDQIDPERIVEALTNRQTMVDGIPVATMSVEVLDYLEEPVIFMRLLPAARQRLNAAGMLPWNNRNKWSIPL